ncbi:Putative 3-oxoacyl-[acyl-carrier-protein] synthase 3 [Desulfonema limicola]|uniref:3-oxoacyl-[acyl-carrier-protein] synthase 3 n=1 Tax=Desulfonema limicola TaxID=45656 RepID=A0A975B6B3_9BACT|nr:3-oxoacyl-ACP synthase III [Desulfonema limicola]QTA79535.1 Putative 3-oxoacyl-[acyl-carrier-protein] synthase 3 [Desulfonema limicola]
MNAASGTPALKSQKEHLLPEKKALASAAVPIQEIGMLTYCGVCRDNLEPATACSVANELGIGPDTQIYDISNACLGVLNGIIQTANAIELGQIKAGLIVSCETAREVVNIAIERLLKNQDMELFKNTIATLTGGAGAVAVLMTNTELAHKTSHKLLGGVIKNASRHHRLCLWGPDAGRCIDGIHVMKTDSIGVLKNGAALGEATYKAFIKEMNWPGTKPDKIICHQVGAAHQKTILESIGIPKEKDFTTYQFLGNIGTVSLPITAAIADERGFLQKGDLTGFFGIGSGLNCMMLGVEW